MGTMEKPTVFAAGYLIFRKTDRLEFLLMKHPDRWDLPKGHVDAGESTQQAALRELAEEAGIPSDAIWTDPEFAFSSQYRVPQRKSPEKQSLKELTIYLGVLLRPLEIVCTEHPGFQWWDWNPPHRIQARAIDPLLSFIEDYFCGHPQVFQRIISQRLGQD